MDEDSSNSEDMAEDLIDAIDDVSDEDYVDDGFTKKEKEIEVSRESRSAGNLSVKEKHRNLKNN
jgi:hypothetical protein